jgi:nicotinamide mononucleotide transporter
MEIFANILPSAFYDDLVQGLAFTLNVIYVILAARGNAWCWVWGFFGTVFQGIVCIDIGLKSDALLQVYYAFSAMYGWYNWRIRSQNSPSLQTSTLPLSYHLGIASLGLLFALPLGYYWDTASFRYEDALLTVFSVITTFLTARKILESWLYWLVIDSSYAFIYFEREKYLLTALCVIYFIFSIKGYFNWKRKLFAVGSLQ